MPFKPNIFTESRIEISISSPFCYPYLLPSHVLSDWIHVWFLSGPGVTGVRCMGPNVCPSVRDLFETSDVTPADQATNSLQTDNANMAIQGNVAMKVTQSSGQLWNQCKRRHPLTKF